MSASEGKRDDHAPNHAPFLTQVVVRIVGATCALTAVVALLLGALDALSRRSPSRSAGIADPDQSISRWLPPGLMAGRTEIALVSPAEAVPHPTRDPVIAAEPPTGPVVLPKSEPEPDPLPGPAPAQSIASVPEPPMVELAVPAPESCPSSVFHDAPAALDEIVATATTPLPTPAPERPPLPPTPAERLGLNAEQRAKAEKCIAQAVYFEARSERLRGQIAVAQVVMNRVFSSFYPNDVCGVVYQNAHQHLACQFTFACDGLPERITEWRSWRRARRIAKRTLDGKIWVTEVGKSTHYHAAYVRPRWARTMKKFARHGLHTFYRPLRWGDGSQETTWSNIIHIAAPAAIVE